MEKVENNEEPIQFVEALIELSKKKIEDNKGNLKIKLQCLAHVLRRAMHHCTEITEEFTPVAFLVEKKEKIYILSKEKIKKEINIKGLYNFISLYSALTPPKIIHTTDITKLEKEIQNVNPETA